MMAKTKKIGVKKVNSTQPPWIGLPSSLTDYEGMVYLILNLTNGKQYIGKKTFWKKIKRKPLKGKKRVRRDKVKSDYESYWGSSEALKEDVAKLGPDKFKRYCLKVCKTKWDLAYEELLEQINREVLFNEGYYNNIIHVRLKGRK